MSYIPAVVNLDAFYRQRFTQPSIKFDSKQIADPRPLDWGNLINVTSGSNPTFPHSANRASTKLTIPAGAVASATRQTKRRFNYQSGQGGLALWTGVFEDGETNLLQQCGFFDDNNGLFVELNGTTFNVVKRSNVTGSPVTSRVAQSAFNIDKLDGTGPSRQTLDPTMAEIWFVDYEWLGAGRVRFGMFFEGRPYYIHQFLHANALDSVYMSTPNLPIRYYIEAQAALGGAVELEHICAAYVSEGGRENTGVAFAVDNGSTARSTANDANIYPICGIQLASGYEGAEVKASALSVHAVTAVDYRWLLCLNPTFSGFTPTFSQYESTAVATALSTTGTVSDEGHVLCSGYANDTAAAQIGGQDFRLGEHVDSSIGKDELWLCVQKVNSGGTEQFYGSLGWAETI